MAAPHRKKLIWNFSSLGITQVINIVLSALVAYYVIRKIGPAAYGVVAVAQVVMFYFSVVTEYGFNQTATRDIALNAGEQQALSRIFFSVLASKILLTVLGFVVLLILCAVVPLFKQHYFLYLMAFAFVVGQGITVNWFFQGVEKMYYIAMAALFSRSLCAVLVFLFVKTPADNALVLFFMGMGNVIAGMVLIYLAFRLYKLKFILPGRNEIARELANGWRITVSNLSITTSQYIGIFILRLVTKSDLVVGYYSIAEKIFFSLKLILGVFTQTVFPRVCQLMQDKKSQLLIFFKQVYLPFFAMVLTGSVIVFVFSPDILYVFIRHVHPQSSFLLRVFCVALVISSLNIPGNLILFAGDHKKNYFRIFTIASIVNVAANSVLAYFFNATGTVLSMVITELFVTLGLSWEVYSIYFAKTKKRPAKILTW
jgi:PST family polysaccharide transporter